MIAGKKVLALIPARGRSKGIKNKNVVKLAGLPLIAHTINAAKNSGYIDSVVLTTDSLDIAEVAMQFGARVPFMRPIHLASDQAKIIEAVLHALRKLNELNEQYDILILLQPTQPFRSSKDIDKALEFFIQSGLNSLAGVSKVEDHPILVRIVDENMRLTSLLGTYSTVRRQDMPAFYRINGAIYINYISDIDSNTSFNDNEYGFIMDRISSVDIDEPLDLFIAEAFWAYRNTIDLDDVN